MPCVETSVQEHNEKIAKEEEEILDAILSRLALVSRPVGRKEMLSNPKAIEATKKEWAGLNKRCWEFKSMREKDDVAKEARETGEEIHFARAHTIMVEKHHILDEDDPRRKFKARGVCLGNQMTDQSNEAAVFSDLGSSPASFEASRWADFYGSLEGTVARLPMLYRLTSKLCSLVVNVGWSSPLKLSQMSTRNCIIPLEDLSYFVRMLSTVILMLVRVGKCTVTKQSRNKDSSPWARIGHQSTSIKGSSCC